MKRIESIFLLFLLAVAPVWAGDNLSLQDITRGVFRAQGIAAIQPAQDGESYLQISDDGQRIEQYSFKTGELTGTLLDLATARGAKLEGIDGYIVL